MVERLGGTLEVVGGVGRETFLAGGLLLFGVALLVWRRARKLFGAASAGKVCFCTGTCRRKGGSWRIGVRVAGWHRLVSATISWRKEG